MKYRGLYTAIVTPFKDNKIDKEALKALVEAQIAGGVDGIHLYTMNNPAVAQHISDNVSSLRAL